MTGGSERTPSRPRAKQRAAKLLPKPVLIRKLQEGYDGRTWQGASVRGIRDRTSHETAAFRPLAERPTIWETVLHLAYVRYREVFRLARRKGGSTKRFPRRLRSSCWSELPPKLTRHAWNEDQELLDTYQVRLVQALERVTDEFVASDGSRHWQFGTEIFGIVLHDAYHVGQMRLLRLSMKNT